MTSPRGNHPGSPFDALTPQDATLSMGHAVGAGGRCERVLPEDASVSSIYLPLPSAGDPDAKGRSTHVDAEGAGAEDELGG